LTTAGDDCDFRKSDVLILHQSPHFLGPGSLSAVGQKPINLGKRLQLSDQGKFVSRIFESVVESSLDLRCLSQNGLNQFKVWFITFQETKHDSIHTNLIERSD